MPHSSKETLSVGWCDNGMTDGKFTEGLLYTTLTSAKHGIFFNNAIRVQGNQIARQRMDLLELWADHVGTDWLLWVDSDVVLTSDILKKLWDAADKISRPVVSGVYFVSKGMEDAHTGALAQHMKRFSFDVAYYGLYWQEYARQMKIKEEEANAGN